MRERRAFPSSSSYVARASKSVNSDMNSWMYLLWGFLSVPKISRLRLAIPCCWNSIFSRRFPVLHTRAGILYSGGAVERRRTKDEFNGNTRPLGSQLAGVPRAHDTKVADVDHPSVS